MMKWMSIIGLLLMVGCQTQPTQVYEKHEVDTKILAHGLNRPIQITEETIVIDVRSKFEYSMAHVPNSIWMDWQEFTEPKKHPGRLLLDLYPQARHLARLGVKPSSRIVVVGMGQKGSGYHEARLAWTLLYLGIRDVQIVDVDTLKVRFSNYQVLPLKEAPIWKPSYVDSIRVGKDEVMDSITGNSKRKTVILDVRTEKEYFKKRRIGKEYALPDIGAINIPINKFFDSKGRPDRGLRRQLTDIGIKKDQKIIVISNAGIRSGAATYALLAIGFSGATNFDGGYFDLR